MQDFYPGVKKSLALPIDPTVGDRIFRYYDTRVISSAQTDFFQASPADGSGVADANYVGMPLTDNKDHIILGLQVVPTLAFAEENAGDGIEPAKILNELRHGIIEIIDTSNQASLFAGDLSDYITGEIVGVNDGTDENYGFMLSSRGLIELDHQLTFVGRASWKVRVTLKKATALSAATWTNAAPGLSSFSFKVYCQVAEGVGFATKVAQFN